MIRLIRLLVIAFVILSAATPALAQRRRGRVPDTGMWAAGASIGATIPTHPNLDNGLEVAGNVEGYLTPRLSVRGQLATAWWDVVGLRFGGTVRPVVLDGNLVYNWEGGAWHPYVTAGVGMYQYRFSGTDSKDTHAGVDVGGGIEYFFTRHATITGEVLYHKVDDFRTPVGTFHDGSYWSFAMGGKAYFGR